MTCFCFGSTIQTTLHPASIHARAFAWTSENPDAIGVAREHGEEPRELLIGGEPEVRRGQRALIEDRVPIGFRGEQHPLGLGAAAFDPEDANRTFHAPIIVAHPRALKPAL